MTASRRVLAAMGDGWRVEDDIKKCAATEVVVTGQLICANQDEADLVARLLPEHIRTSVNEVGCLSFAIEQTADPLVWQLDERFVDGAAFQAHRDRVVSSEWGRAMRGVKRRYTVL